MAKIKSIHGYAGQYKEIANRIKDERDDEALDIAAHEMAKAVNSDAVLVAAPSSSGTNRAMAILAQKIKAHTSEKYEVRAVEAIKRKYPVPSQFLLRQAGKSALTKEQQAESMKVVKRIPEDMPIIAIDNVKSGKANTINGMEITFGRPIKALVYADASRQKRVRRNPAAPLVVMVSGSRNYEHLENVSAVLRTIPRGSIILHGGAVGVDSQANNVALTFGCFDVKAVLPDWKKYGKAAGQIRNKEMVAQADYLFAFWDGKSKGTLGAIKAAQNAGVEFQVIYDQPMV